ncbi:MAG: hypothetical protein MRY79_05170 [Alphaproteobacteria bacterium]|nr:hypothetical protein [Alphaproteobacteria bacterium]
MAQTPTEALAAGYQDPAFSHINFGDSRPKRQPQEEQPVVPTEENGFEGFSHEIVPGQKWQSLIGTLRYKNFKGATLAPIHRVSTEGWRFGPHPDKSSHEQQEAEQSAPIETEEEDVPITVELEEVQDITDIENSPALEELKSIGVEDIKRAMLGVFDPKTSDLVKGGVLTYLRLSPKGQDFSDNVHLAIQSQLVSGELDEVGQQAYATLEGLYPEIMQMQEREGQIAQDQEEGKSQALIDAGRVHNDFIAQSIGKEVDEALYDLCATFQKAVDIYGLDKPKRLFRSSKDAFGCVISKETRETLEKFKALRAEWKEMWEQRGTVETAVQKAQILNDLMVLSAHFNKALADHEGAQALNENKKIQSFTAGLIQVRLGRRDMVEGFMQTKI